MRLGLLRAPLWRLSCGNVRDWPNVRIHGIVDITEIIWSLNIPLKIIQYVQQNQNRTLTSDSSSRTSMLAF